MTQRDGRPQEFGPYRVLRRIGEGGMGVVYLAVDSAQRQVAIKALRSAVAGERDARRRLAREVETMRRVRSPYVAEVLDADLTCEPPYIVTQYVRGRTLDQLVNESGPLNGPALARLARGSTAALCAVHAAGVVHRDLKPGNIMLSEGEPVVIDFGIAHAADSSKITQTGMFMGTPGYLAPEVIEGKGATQASDVHSWGSTIAFAATGRPPFGTGTFEVIFFRIMNGSPDLDGCPPALLGLLTAALARDPLRRPSAAELAARLGVLAPADLRPGPGRAAVQGGAAGGASSPAGDAPAGAPAGAGAGPGASPGLPAAGVPAVAPAGLAAAAAAAAAAASVASPPDSGATVSPDAPTIDPVPLPAGPPVSATVADAARPAWAGGPGQDGEDAATQRGADEDATDEGAVGRPAADPGPAGPDATAAGALAGAAAAGAPSAGPAGGGPESRGAGAAGATGQAAPGPESAGSASPGAAGAGAAGSAAAGLASAGAGAAAGPAASAAESAGAAAAGLAAGAGAAGALAAGAAAAAASGLSPAGAGAADGSAGSGRAADSGPAADRTVTRVPGQGSAPVSDAATDPAGDRPATHVAGAGGPAPASPDPADRYATWAPGQAGPGQATHAAAGSGSAAAGPADRSATQAPGLAGGGAAVPGVLSAAAAAAGAGGGNAGSATVTNVPGAGAPGPGAVPAGQPGGASAYPGAAAAGAAGAAGPAGAGLAGAGLGGAGADGHDPHLDLASSPAAAVAAARLNQTQPMPIVRDPGPGSLSDLLPDVQYGPAASGRRKGPPGGPYDPNATGVIGGPYDPQAGPNRAAKYGLAQPAPARGQHLFVLLVVLAGAGLSILLPVAGGLIALTALLALRAGDLTRNWAARHRAKRGAAAAMSALVYPGMLVWSGITMIALVPVALVAAGIAVMLTILAVPAHPFAQAAAYASGAIVLCYGLGPGSSAPRRQLGRIYAAMARSPGGAAVILFFAGALCLAALVAAFSQLPFYWPLEHLRVRIDHWQPLRDLARTLRATLMSWYHQIFS
jgi:predicted Ser/Thr protein kinase